MKDEEVKDMPFVPVFAEKDVPVVQFTARGFVKARPVLRTASAVVKKKKA